ncbi:MAG: hypothetical protein IPM53_26540 [Anaerolineaceae bacterium]|nr:hypothetical protein [Anaerolineaceae bacterium]
MAKRDYMAFLLRLWREKRDGAWRALLENPNNGERAAFATLAELVTFLEEKTGETIQTTAVPAEDKLVTPNIDKNQ